MKNAGKFLLWILAFLGLVVLCYSVVFFFLVFEDTKMLGVIFLCSGLWGILEMSGVVKTRLFRERRSNQIIGTIGAILVGLYFLLR